MPVQSMYQCAGAAVPEFHAVAGCGSQRLSVRTERNCPDAVEPAIECANPFAGARVPQNHSCPASRGDGVPLNAEGDRGYRRGCALNRTDSFPALNIPDPDSLILTRGIKKLAVLAEQRGSNDTSVPLKGP